MCKENSICSFSCTFFPPDVSVPGGRCRLWGREVPASSQQILIYSLPYASTATAGRSLPSSLRTAGSSLPRATPQMDLTLNRP
ncbi:hypothetical protein AOLI_G00259580 [Acnodon oligacanthus]